MPVVHADDAVVHEMHGSVFASYAAPARGSHELCAWRLEVPGGSRGVAHAVSKEEVLLVLSGTLAVTLSTGQGGEPEAVAAAGAVARAGAGEPSLVSAGDVVVVPAGAVLRIDNAGSEPASAWVTTSVGLEGMLPDGSRISPPWVR